MAPSISIQPISPAHAPQVAKIHQASQEGTFLTALGLDFLTLLYEAMSQSEHTLGWVCLSSAGEVVGFIVGTVDTGAMFKEVVRRRPVRLTWLVLRRAVSRPQLLWQALKTLAYPQQSDSTAPKSELLAMALAPGWRGQGWGSQLIEHLRKGLQAENQTAVLVTVDGQNSGAQRFYQRHGFTLLYETEMYGRKMRHFVLSLGPKDTDAR